MDWLNKIDLRHDNNNRIFISYINPYELAIEEKTWLMLKILIYFIYIVLFYRYLLFFFIPLIPFVTYIACMMNMKKNAVAILPRTQNTRRKQASIITICLITSHPLHKV